MNRVMITFIQKDSSARSHCQIPSRRQCWLLLDQRGSEASPRTIKAMAYGWGVTKDDTQAVSWYRKAADQGNAIAQSNLGIMYESGRGVGIDETQAIAWYRKAAEQGNEYAENKIAKLGSNDLDAKPAEIHLNNFNCRISSSYVITEGEVTNIS